MNEGAPISGDLQALELNAWQSRLRVVQREVAHACTLAGRTAESVRMVAVSKIQPVARIRAAYQAGQRAFGENYLQEALPKIEALQDLVEIEWHFIGPIQANKTRAIATHFAWVHSVDRYKVAERLAAQRPLDKNPLQVCIQVNISGETTKSGVPPAEAIALAKAVSQLPMLQLRGFMGIAAPASTETSPRKEFHCLRQLYQTAQQEGLAVDTLSMGMSHDFPAAIAEGATLLRIGTALFGEREREEALKPIAESNNE